MAIRYKALTELYHETQRSVTAPAQWQAFLASACRNYRLSFDEQLLVYAQRPDATAVLEIERWNKRFGRWVNRGANGIAVFDGEHTGRPRLKYYFDISDTHEGNFPQPIPLWAVRPEYEPEIIETLENSFGELEHKEDLGAALLSAAKNAVEDNIQDYLSELKTVTEGSFLEELDEYNVEVLYRKALENSIGYMLMVRCGLDPAGTFEDEDFRDVLNFNTPETLNALGVATGDISQMCLSEISRTVLALQRQPQKENRTFADQQKIHICGNAEAAVAAKLTFQLVAEVGRLIVKEFDGFSVGKAVCKVDILAYKRAELFHLGHPVNMQIVEFIHQRLLILRKGFRAAKVFIPLPVIELGQRILQVGPRLFGGKFLAGHVLHADLDQIV